MKTKQYFRLSEYEREMISRGQVREDSFREIARSLGRSPSTISREVKQGMAHRQYCGDCAVRLSRKRARKRRLGYSKIERNPELKHYIIGKLTAFWSPEQIAARLKEAYRKEHMHVSHEAIYQYLYIKPSRELRTLLRRGHMYRYHKGGRKNKSSTQGQISNMTTIEERPEEVVARLIPGHWEGDLIKGAHNKSVIGTLVERRTRYVVLVPLKRFDATSVRKAFAREFAKFPSDMKKTLTYDRGKEMAEHLSFTLSTDIKVYFAHPRSPWERGTNENTNGLIRQFFPKGTDFSEVSRYKIKQAQALLNDRPRKTLEWKKPDEVLWVVLR